MNRITEKNDYIKEKLKFFKNPIILELGVNRGGSTKIFLNYVEQNNGKVFSIDIKDCSNVSNSKKWSFLISDDLDYNYITTKFPEILINGIDILFVDITVLSPDFSAIIRKAPFCLASIIKSDPSNWAPLIATKM